MKNPFYRALTLKHAAREYQVMEGDRIVATFVSENAARFFIETVNKQLDEARIL